MFELKKLQEERAALLTKIQDMGKTVKAESRSLKSDEQETMNKMLDEFEQYDAEIDKAETLVRADNIGKEIRSKTEKRVQPRRGLASDRDAQNAVKAFILKDFGGDKTTEYRDSAERCGFDWRQQSMEIPLKFSYSAWESKGREQRSTQDGMAVGSIPNILGGDWVVPDLMADMVDISLRQYCVYRNICRVYPTETGNQPLLWPQLNDIQNNVAVDHTENTNDLEADATLGQVSITSTMRGSGVFPISIELLRDSVISLLPILAEALTRRIGLLESTEFTTALLATSGLGSSTTVTQGVVTYDDCQTALWKANFAYQQEPGYGVLCSQDFARNSLSWVDANNRPLWNMNTVDIGRGFKTFLGYPVEVCNQLGTVAAGNTCAVFGSFAERAVVRQVGSMMVFLLNELYLAQLARGIVAANQAGFAVTRPEAFTKLVVHS